MNAQPPDNSRLVWILILVLGVLAANAPEARIGNRQKCLSGSYVSQRGEMTDVVGMGSACETLRVNMALNVSFDQELESGTVKHGTARQPESLTLGSVVPYWVFLWFGATYVFPSIVLCIWAILDCLTKSHLSGGYKLLWITLILVTGLIGASAYLLHYRQEPGNTEKGSTEHVS